MTFTPDLLLAFGGPIFVALAIWFFFFRPPTDLHETVDTFPREDEDSSTVGNRPPTTVDRDWLRRDGYFTSNDTG